ncbi:hypothetical protein AUJ66_02480 [Candidatus Desantisbacteria bacterium CG1_02_38_46]|nr:MAG: hypothetical protein AUJ66_02480 [Candidatus Desantisbacteria bacterium CG1_02_38_46]
MIRRKVITIIILLAITGLAQSEEKSITNTLLWSILLPGGGHFYLGQPTAGNIYLMAESLLFITGKSLENALASGEWNFFYINTLKIHELNIFTSYREARILNNNEGYTTPIDKTPLHKLILAPFRWENIKSPYVYGFFLAGIAINATEGYLNPQRKGFDRISTINIMNTGFDRECGTAVYEGMWLTLSFDSAVSEECAYRGLLQVECEETMGRTAGLFVSSGIFGLGHVTNWGDGKSWAYGGIATLSGLYLGWLFQKEGYRLEKPIAAHFWFNFAAGTTLFLIDPANNPLGIKMNFSF